MPNFNLNVDKSNRYNQPRIKFYEDGIYYIRYCIMKETGEDISISLLRLAFKFFVEYAIYNWIHEKKLAFLHFGTFYTKWLPECIKKNRKGEKIYIPSFPYPVINFSDTVRNALKFGSYHFTSPEFLNAKKKDYKGLFHSIRLRDFDEFNLEDAPDESDLQVDFYSSFQQDGDRLKIDIS